MPTLFQPNVVTECLRAGRRSFQRLMVARDLEQAALQPLLQLAKQRNVPIQSATRQQLDQMSQGAIHQGVALVVGNYPYLDIDDLLPIPAQRGEPPLFLLLDLLQSPSNVGRLLRTAAAVGVHGIILPDRRGAEIDSNVAAASMGLCEHLAIAKVTNLVQAMQMLKKRGDCWLVGMEHSPRAESLPNARIPQPLGIVVGNEGQGLRPLVAKTCDMLISIPMRAGVDSLNVSVAGSVLLYAVWQQRGYAGSG